MPTFETPEPISVRLEVGGGSIRIAATERADTVVQVRPRDASHSSDVWAAEHTRVDFRDGKLIVSGPRRGVPRFRGGAIDVEIALPSRSRFYATLASADLRAEGEYADVRFGSASGHVHVDRVAGKIKAANASGSFTVNSVEGYASLGTASGTVAVGDLVGDAKFKAASGSLSVDTLRGKLKSRTASGSVAVNAAVSGAVSAHTSSGEVTVAVPEGTAVRLDISTASGASGVIINNLESTDGPEDGDETLVLEVRSGAGDVEIHRASPAAVT